jgi:hypothetical protein
MGDYEEQSDKVSGWGYPRPWDQLLTDGGVSKAKVSQVSDTWERVQPRGLTADKVQGHEPSMSEPEGVGTLNLQSWTK